MAEFRADCGKGADASPVREMVQQLLAASAEFEALWRAQDVLGREGGRREFAHPQRGRLSFNQLALQPLAQPDLRLVLLLAEQR